MDRTARISCFLALSLAALGGCSKDTKKAEAPAPHKIQGKAELQYQAGTANDAALNANGPSVYIVEGMRRYRLFLRRPVDVVHGREYAVEGVYAQKVIDELGDPDNGKNGYPLDTSCTKVVKTAWPGLAFDTLDAQTEVLRARVKRYPARPVFLVMRITPVTGEAKKEAAAEEKEIPEVTVPGEKQRALLIEGPTTFPAPLWEPAGGTAKCKLAIDEEGKVSELETGAQLCESVDWTKFRYKPTMQKGQPAIVKTEVEVKFEPRK